MPAFVRFEHNGETAYGTLTGESVAALRGGLFDAPETTGQTLDLAAVRLLAPCAPHKIFAVGLNYKSHLGDRKIPEYPEIFYKPVSSLQAPGGPVELPDDALDVHYEGELVVVVGKTLRDASRAEAESAVFGVTCGNDISDRNWQRGAGKDLQWWRAKGCDTFSPLGPVIVTDANYADLAICTRLNGKVVQSQRTSDLIFGVPEILSFISRYATIEQGDIVYTGTPGDTSRMVPGDVVEVEIESLGVLRNPITRR